MKNMKKVIRNTLLFMAGWAVAMIIFSLTHKVTDLQYLLQIFLIPATVLGLIGFLSAIFANKNPQPKKMLSIWLLIAGIAVDQAIKIYLFAQNWQEMNIPIIEPVFYLNPSQNTLGSYLWVLLGLKNTSHLLNIILFIIIGTLFTELYRFYVQYKGNSFWIKGAFHLFLIGLLANIIDNAVHGGSLDYLSINPFYITDLKDIFITLGELYLLIEVIDQKLWKSDKGFEKSFNGFIKKDFKRLFEKNKKS